jgi:hypothetical protein
MVAAQGALASRRHRSRGRDIPGIGSRRRLQGARDHQPDSKKPRAGEITVAGLGAHCGADVCGRTPTTHF